MKKRIISVFIMAVCLTLLVSQIFTASSLEGKSPFGNWVKISEECESQQKPASYDDFHNLNGDIFVADKKRNAIYTSNDNCKTWSFYQINDLLMTANSKSKVYALNGSQRLVEATGGIELYIDSSSDGKTFSKTTLKTWEISGNKLYNFRDLVVCGDWLYTLGYNYWSGNICLLYGNTVDGELAELGSYSNYTVIRLSVVDSTMYVSIAINDYDVDERVNIYKIGDDHKSLIACDNGIYNSDRRNNLGFSIINDGDTLYAYNSKQLFKSTDNADTWTEINCNFPTDIANSYFWFDSLRINQGRLFAAFESDDFNPFIEYILMSSDGGETWTDISKNQLNFFDDKSYPVPENAFRSMEIVENNLYVGTSIGDLYSLQINANVSFDTAGGKEEIADLKGVPIGGKIQMPKSPVKEGYTFDGWYTSDGAKWDFSNDKINSDITLVAHFTKNPETTTPATKPTEADTPDTGEKTHTMPVVICLAALSLGILIFRKKRQV